MAYKPLRMDLIELIQEYYKKGYPIKKIARLLGVSKNTVKKYKSSSHRVAESAKRDKELELQLAKIVEELGKVGVTRYLLWEEYIKEHPEGFSYSRFCRKLSNYRSIQDVTIRLDHKAAHTLSVDFTGKKIPWTDIKGQIQYAEVLVCTMPYSAKTFAVALASQKQEDFIDGLNQALLYFGGLPKVILSDNLKSFVIKSDKYEPSFNDLCIQLATYYGIDLSATRVGKPKDKASVERHVGIVYNKIYAPLRDQKFKNIRQINIAMLPLLDKMNEAKMQGKTYSRNELFVRDEKPHMPSLPSEMFAVKKSTRAKVQRNYHVILGEDWHQYSVPYKYVGKQTQIIYTNKQVEVYCETQRIAVHPRDRRYQGYSTLAAHMPEKHKKYLEQRGWDADYFISQAEKIGPNTKWAITELLQKKQLVEQTYNSCLGLIRLKEKYSSQRLEAACKKARTTHRISYGIVKKILVNNMDQIEETPETQLSLNIPPHENLRGKQNYS